MQDNTNQYNTFTPFTFTRIQTFTATDVFTLVLIRMTVSSLLWEYAACRLRRSSAV